QLQGRNERPYRLPDLQEKVKKMPASKPDISARTGFSEEEKLKISKELIDLQIETNKMKEQCETENFELKKMILGLENRVQELELRGQKVTMERDGLEERLHTLEASRKELAEEYIILKSNYLALGKELEQEVMKNEKLSLELVNLATTRSTFPRTESNPITAVDTEAPDQPEREQAMVHHASAPEVKVRASLPSHELPGEDGSNKNLLPLAKTSQNIKEL
ncbi:CCD78 protein, partial [Turnix velox]|nr:CCD78 protein [Turnix velox]